MVPARATLPKAELVRGLDFTGAAALVAGSMIGTGVFFKAAIMSQQVGSPALVMLAWLVAGLMSLAGALTYAELGGMIPKAGGEYAYLRAAYGNLPAFLDGWMRAVVASAGNAALGAGFAALLGAIIPLNVVWGSTKLHLFGQEILWRLGLREMVAVSVILLFGVVNCAGVRFGGRVQTALTAAKIGGILIIIAGAYFFSKGGTVANLEIPVRWSGTKLFGAAVLSALWACDGWAFMPTVAAEVKDAARNVPRALIVGVLCVLALYGLVNIAYFYVLPFHEVATANSTAYRDALPVASKAAATFSGRARPGFAFDSAIDFDGGCAERGDSFAGAGAVRHGARWSDAGAAGRSFARDECSGDECSGADGVGLRPCIVRNFRSAYGPDYFRPVDFLWPDRRGGVRAAAQDAGRFGRIA